MSALHSEIRALARLAWPVVLTQMSMMMLGLVDTRMVGHLGSVELSAVGLADAIMFGSLILGMGLVMGIDPIVSQAHGAGEGKLAGLAMQRGIVLGVVASVPLTVVWLHTEEILLLLGQDRQLASLAQVYADAQIFSIAPVLVFMAMRQYLQGRGDVTTPLWVAVLANPLNVLFNWALIFGHLGLPALGVTGAGLATGLSRLFMVVALAALLFGRGKHRGAWTPWSRASFSWAGQRQVLRYGIPVGAQYGLEVWAFSCSNLMAGLLMHPAVAAHIVVLKLASFTFMVPVGISHAGAVRVGNLLGARDRHGAQRAAWVALTLGGGVMLFAALTFILFGRPLASIFTGDEEVIALCLAIFPIAAAFQLFDGTQAVGGGILRGMGNPRPAALANLVGFYLLAIPMAWWLGFERGLGLPGVWWGYAAGLAAIAILLVAWIAVRGPSRVRRLAISPP
ncbi:MAG: MATE family efflux transporter [Planctomycetota bacterium]|jgi:MATE family multidrug resistance protein